MGVFNDPVIVDLVNDLVITLGRGGEMRHLKEEVKSGDKSAKAALEELEAAARESGDSVYIRTTPTWRWLKGRSRSERKGG